MPDSGGVVDGSAAVDAMDSARIVTCRLYDGMGDQTVALKGDFPAQLAIFQGLCSFAYNVYHGGPTRDSGQNYISLGTFRKNGSLVHTPVWLYVMMSTRFGKIQLCAE